MMSCLEECNFYASKRQYVYDYTRRYSKVSKDIEIAGCLRGYCTEKEGV